MKIFAERLKYLRQVYKIPQSTLAELLNFRPNAISNYETSRNTPSFKNLIKIADYFDVSLDYLLGRSGEIRHTDFESVFKDVLDYFEDYTIADLFNFARIYKENRFR